ncbi:conserved hypothetical protein [Brevibacillus sp. IT-7CA2]|uniref:hypothetical protein n=1 Tax=Brevibacillus sp. IT-7CA2 TaxID=3026436 RepID=UPI0039E1F3DD
MTRMSRQDLLNGLAQNYLIEKEKNKIWNRENSSSYSIAQGQLTGACMALNLDFEESDRTVTIFTRDRKRVVTKMEI